MALRSAQLGPTLPELAGPRAWRAIRLLAAAAALAAVLALLTRGAAEDVVVSKGPVAYNFLLAAPLRQVGPGLVEQRRGATLVQSLRVTPWVLPASPVDDVALLPVVAEGLEARLARHLARFEVADEGRARINLNPGYTIGWTAVDNGRRLFGREYLLFEDLPRARRGVLLELVATYAAGVSDPGAVGRQGALKTALRSFRFGTQRP